MTFWMVWVEGNRGSEYKHETIESARTEAERLAEMNQNIGKKVYVLQAMSYATVSRPVHWEAL